MTVGADGEQFPTIAGVRRVNIPAQSAKYRLVSRSGRFGEFLYRKGAENSLSLKFTIRKHHKSEFCQVVRGSKESGMPGHSTHIARSGVMNNASERGGRFRIDFRRSDPGLEGRSRQKTRV